VVLTYERKLLMRVLRYLAEVLVGDEDFSGLKVYLPDGSSSASSDSDPDSESMN